MSHISESLLGLAVRRKAGARDSVCMHACMFFVYVSVVCIRWRAYGAGASLCVKASVSKRMSVSEGLSVCCLSVSDVCADVKLMSRQA